MLDGMNIDLLEKYYNKLELKIKMYESDYNFHKEKLRNINCLSIELKNKEDRCSKCLRVNERLSSKLIKVTMDCIFDTQFCCLICEECKKDDKRAKIYSKISKSYENIELMKKRSNRIAILKDMIKNTK
jgi:hypothetical protein